MKNKIAQSLLLSALFLLVLPNLARAQAHISPRHHGGFHGGRWFESLQLSDAQKSALQNLFAASRDNFRSLRERLYQQRQLWRNAAETQPFDESQVRYQAQEMAKLQTELMVAQAALINQVSSLLTPEQRVQWNNLREQRKQQFKERFERRRNNPAAQRG